MLTLWTKKRIKYVMLWRCHAKFVPSAFTWRACALGLLFYNPCGFSVLRHWKKVLGCPWQGSFVGYEKMWVFLIWVSMPDVFPQCFRGCEYCVPLPLPGWFWWWMGNCSEKDRRKFPHLSTLHGMDDNDYFDLIFINLASLRIIEIRECSSFWKKLVPVMTLLTTGMASDVSLGCGFWSLMVCQWFEGQTAVLTLALLCGWCRGSCTITVMLSDAIRCLPCPSAWVYNPLKYSGCPFGTHFL